MAKTGRPKLDISGPEVQKLAELNCSNQEIADFFDCDATTIARRFARELRMGRAAWKMSIRRGQYKRAKAGSDKMLIHLGLTELGQVQKVVVSNPKDEEAARMREAMSGASKEELAALVAGFDKLAARVK